MNVFRLLLVFFIVVMSGGVMAAEDQVSPHFFSMMQDVPLMPGLVEIREQSLQFDKPEGRVAESVAEMQRVSVDSLSAFYESSLPQFGWMRIKGHEFVRGAERLSFNFESVDGHDFVRVMLSPR